VEHPVQLLDVRTVARRLGVGRSTVYELISRGELPSVRIGQRRLVSEQQLADFVRSLEEGAK
jgi:excisionase family DNA binding protein